MMNMKGLLKSVVNLAIASSFLIWNISMAEPQEGQMAAGNQSSQNNVSQVGQVATGNQSLQNNLSQIGQAANALISQAGAQTAINNETVKSNQPSVSGIILNKIDSGQSATLQGSRLDNGQVWIVNPKEILSTSTSQVNDPRLVAATMGIINSDIMNGNHAIHGSTTAEEGIDALVAPGVQKNGVVQANLGTVSLSTGTAFVLDLKGDQLINFGVNKSVPDAGKIAATGGKVLMAANSAAQVVENVVSMSGVTEATIAATGQHGEIILNGGNANTTIVTERSNASNDRHIETLGHFVNVNATTIETGSDHRNSHKNVKKDLPE